MSNFNLPGGPDSRHEGYYFVSKQTLSQLTDLKPDTFKTYRKRDWKEGIHWNGNGDESKRRLIRYNWPLIEDWFHNQNDPDAHQRAIEHYLATRLSNQKKIRTRHSKYKKDNQLDE